MSEKAKLLTAMARECVHEKLTCELDRREVKELGLSIFGERAFHRETMLKAKTLI